MLVEGRRGPWRGCGGVGKTIRSLRLRCPRIVTSNLFSDPSSDLTTDVEMFYSSQCGGFVFDFLFWGVWGATMAVRQRNTRTNNTRDR